MLGTDATSVPGQLTLLPTPAVNDMGAAYTPETWDAWTARMQAAHGNGNGHGKSLSIEALRMLPTPRASDGPDGTSHARSWSTTDRSLHTVVHTGELVAQDWREYEAAIRRQENAFGRPAPLPTEPGAKGQPRLSPRFVEWLMGLPEGWVTDVPGISRNDQLKALGNGVVPQQAAAALRAFLADTAKAVAA